MDIMINFNKKYFRSIGFFFTALVACASISCAGNLKNKSVKIEDQPKQRYISSPSTPAAIAWSSFEYFVDEDKFISGIKFFDANKRQVGTYYDKKQYLRMLNLEEDQKEIGQSSAIILSPKKEQLLVTIWMSGKHHVYRIFNPNISTGEPVCEIFGEGDYPEKIEHKFKKDNLSIKVQERIGKINFVSCNYLKINRHKK